ncbi:MAG: hypothetical protein Q8R30_04745 [bacterium]|nr:hypothetical protein [bacterium]
MYKTSSPIRLLAIDPGSRYLGVAVFENLRLLDWRIKLTYAQEGDCQAAVSCARKVVRLYMKRYEIKSLVVKRCDHCRGRKSEVVTAMVKEFQRFGKQQRLQVSACDPDKARKFFCKERRAATMEVAKIITSEWYPFLSHLYEKTKAKPWYREKYYLQMFLAIALGLYWLLRFHQKQLPSGPQNEVNYPY